MLCRGGAGVVYTLEKSGFARTRGLVDTSYYRRIGQSHDTRCTHGIHTSGVRAGHALCFTHTLVSCIFSVFCALFNKSLSYSIFSVHLPEYIFSLDFDFLLLIMISRPVLCLHCSLPTFSICGVPRASATTVQPHPPFMIAIPLFPPTCFPHHAYSNEFAWSRYTGFSGEPASAFSTELLAPRMGLQCTVFAPVPPLMGLQCTVVGVLECAHVLKS